jgi:DNA-binding transcriptional LysR family regulator
VDPRHIDLNLLVVFDRLLIERRVSKVAEALGVSQPAVSNALARLRRQLNDPLFLPTPHGMQPTPLAEQMAEPVANALSMIHSALNQRTSFDPATSQRAFKIAMTDIGEIYFLPRLLREFSRTAPRVSLSTLRNTAANLGDEMEAGSVDLALGYLPTLKTGFFQRQLFRHRYVCLFRKGHVLNKRRISLADYIRAEHVVVVAAGTGHNTVDAVLERSGIVRNIRLTVPHFVAVGHILRDTDMIATVPERFAERVAGPFGLAYLPHPAKLPEIAINLFWHAKSHKDPANQWLREAVIRLHADVGSPS